VSLPGYFPESKSVLHDGAVVFRALTFSLVRCHEPFLSSPHSKYDRCRATSNELRLGCQVARLLSHSNRAYPTDTPRPGRLGEEGLLIWLVNSQPERETDLVSIASCKLMKKLFLVVHVGSMRASRPPSAPSGPEWLIPNSPDLNPKEVLQSLLSGTDISLVDPACFRYLVP
jgi:hypothetical protein